MEILDIVDEQGNPTGEVVERAKAHAQGIRHRTAHVWLLRRKNGSIQILLQKRSLNKDSYPGCYDISSAGHIPAGCGYEESALRELREELGLTIRSSELHPCGDRFVRSDDVFHGQPFHDRQVSRVFFVWTDREETDFTLQKEELDGVLWMDLDTCIEAVRSNAIPHCIFLEELLMVKHHAQAHPIPATASMISDIAPLVKALWPEDSLEGIRQMLAESIEGDETALFAQYAQDVCVGVALCGLRHDYVEGCETSPVGYLEGIYVDEAHRLEGIANRLCKECEAWAKGKGCSEFASDCEVDNAASLAFHLGIGFTEENRIICFRKPL